LHLWEVCMLFYELEERNWGAYLCWKSRRDHYLESSRDAALERTYASNEREHTYVTPPAWPLSQPRPWLPSPNGIYNELIVHQRESLLGNASTTTVVESSSWWPFFGWLLSLDDSCRYGPVIVLIHHGVCKVWVCALEAADRSSLLCERADECWRVTTKRLGSFYTRPQNVEIIYRSSIERYCE
jgi:hypothetical protein